MPGRAHEKRVEVTTTTIEERLAEIGRHIDRLQARERAGVAEVKLRVQGHLDALRQEEASVQAAVVKARDEAEAKLEQLKTRLEVAEHSLAADVAEDWAKFAAAVQAELHSWDTYLERLQTKAATKAGKAREQAEAAISGLRQRRITVTEHLAQVRDASGDAWREQKQRVAAARDELERKADELSAKSARRT